MKEFYIGYKFDTEQGERTFRIVERPIRECVKLLDLEETTLFEDIEAVRVASKEILGYSVVWHPGHQKSYSYASLYCNSVSKVQLDEICATDVGYQIPAHSISPTDEDTDYSSAEVELGLDDEENDIYFDIKNDTYDNLINDDYDTILL